MARKPCSRCGRAQAVRPGGLCNRCHAALAAEPREIVVPTETLPLERIRTDGGTQARVALHEGTVEEYADAMRSGERFPAGVAYFDGMHYWLADGFHRYAARGRAGFADIELEVRAGTARDALLHAVGANASHGLPRTVEDKRRAVEMLLDDPEWRLRSHNWIAEQARVSWSFVERLVNSRERDDEAPKARKAKDGRTMPARIEYPANFDDDPVKHASKSLSEPEPTAPEAVEDDPGSTLPEALVSVFAAGKGLTRALYHLNLIAGLVEEARKAGVSAQQLRPIQSDLDNVKNAIKAAVPFAVCPVCQGSRCLDGSKSPCRGLGYVTEDVCKRLPQELQARCQRVQP